MRIAHVVESLDIGGLEHVVVALAAAQHARGNEVRIICLWRRGALAERAELAGVRVECCDKKSGLDAQALRRMRTLLREFAGDVLHTHNPMAHYYAVAAALGLGIPRVLNSRHGMGSGELSARREKLYRLALLATDHAVSVCEAARQRFVAHGVMPASKASVVRNGIDLSRFVARNAAAGAALRTALGLPDEVVLFGTVGRLNEAKQQGRLLVALRTLLDTGVPAALVIAGDGELRAALETQTDSLGLRERVRLLGARNDVPDLLAAMDVFVLPSRTEGYSLALVEASAAALPIIATAVGGNAEIVHDGVTGRVIPAGDDDRLAAAMRELALDAPRRASLGAQARAWALREGSLDAMCDGYQRLYGEAAQSSAARLRDGISA
ncbi:glycosyltransferase [Piscinibacter sp.]|uniref:glycosyltransferase n=1 Tax=Piscinibacter sp. TaxID=1903157 RepID=UPI001D915A2C|nr:glycosyltransferase [Piscinibacter sp.]MBK7529207.1 glycosyltransferase [Piscinibacter sp.]HNW63639.1 glycosyltransferase [Piscinibacter sp.]